MKILLTNDDGIFAEGLRALHKQFSAKHSVTVIAPDRERSAVGHGITLNEPLRAKDMVINGSNHCYAINGTPADCIKMGVLNLLDTKPDIVISGINPGANTGVNINYSGTVAAAREAALYGILSIAVSIPGSKPRNYNDAALFIEELVEKVSKNNVPFGTVLNVNIPDMPKEAIQGVKITKQGMEFPYEYIKKNVDPRQRTYFWYGCDMQKAFEDRNVDDAVLHDGYISITPIQCDMTHYHLIDELKELEI